MDRVHSNNLQFSYFKKVYHFTKLPNECIIHNHMPKWMLQGSIRPRIKNKFGNLRWADNSREVIISSNFFRLWILYTSISERKYLSQSYAICIPWWNINHWGSATIRREFLFRQIHTHNTLLLKTKPNLSRFWLCYRDS
jgi:hypothetical protein